MNSPRLSASPTYIPSVTDVYEALGLRPADDGRPKQCVTCGHTVGDVLAKDLDPMPYRCDVCEMRDRRSRREALRLFTTTIAAGGSEDDALMAATGTMAEVA